MTSMLNDRFEMLERQPVSEGDFTRLAYKARIVPKSSTADDGAIVLLRLLPVGADTPSVRSAADQALDIPPSQNVVRFYGLTEIAGQSDIQDGTYIVTEYTRGISLRERIRRIAPFSIAVSLDICIAIANALVKANDAGVGHGALRPELVMLTPEGQVKVSDFLLSAAMCVALRQDQLYYDDRRALGLLLYEMLTGVAPDHIIVISEHSPRHLNGNVPPALDGIVRKSTSLDTGRNYADIARMLTDLTTAREDLRNGKPLTWTPLSDATVPQPARPPSVRQPGALTEAAKELTEEKHTMTRRSQRDDDDAEEDDYPLWPKVLLSILAAIVIGLVFAGVYLFTIFSVPSDIIVPNLVGKQFSDAQKIADDQHFALVKSEDNYSDILPAGLINEQNPAPGRSIKAGKEVDVSVSDGPRLVVVPDLSEMTAPRAEQVLASAGLPEGSVSNEFSDTVPKGVVISQSPDAASSVAHDSPVNIVVSKGPTPPVAPTGLTATSSSDSEIDLAWNDDDNAVTYNIYRDGQKYQTGIPQAAFSDVNLQSGESHTYAITAVNANGESPTSSKAQATTMVEGAPPDTSDVTPPIESSPDNGERPASPTAPTERHFEIRFRVPHHGPHNVQIEVQDTTGTNIVYDQDRDPGDIVDDNVEGFGNKIIFRIFIDGKLVRQDTK
jgi:eukaryotic-like serine/threonine-protein kinase